MANPIRVQCLKCRRRLATYDGVGGRTVVQDTDKYPLGDSMYPRFYCRKDGWRPAFDLIAFLHRSHIYFDDDGGDHYTFLRGRAKYQNTDELVFV